MKKLIFVGLCMLSSGVFAAGSPACAVGTASAISGGGAAEFVKIGFTPKCSANTYVAYQQNAIAIGVAGGSAKGKNVFGGSSAGGGVISVGGCAATGCTASEPAAATQALLDLAT